MTKVLGGVASDDYKIARDKFWELALETDEFKQCDFESEFEKLVTFVECSRVAEKLLRAQGEVGVPVHVGVPAHLEVLHRRL
mmetsp:Transcript_29231/g.73393  ORF Transcript_29231/g.73393 Transcript_29231/m.73393 type:complete len:82 (+) Transcript_29231:865-1110(+)